MLKDRFDVVLSTPYKRDHASAVPHAYSAPMARQMPDDTHQKVFEFSGNAFLSIG